mmetsp:Transcript_34461/g.63854  ORF Transcript_34461/g.63854 Transcript_34461/m.63854 type:complete len:192 (-) Transcript_34461:265-840(-)
MMTIHEQDLSRQAKMHKRRVHLLQQILHDISQAAYGQEYMQLANEVASSYMKILDIKEEMFPSKPTSQRAEAINKINRITHKAILYHRLFIRGFHENLGPDPPEKMEGYLQRPYLEARFHVARLYTKIIGDSVQSTCKLNQASLLEYKTIIRLVEKYKCKEFVEELKICKDMVDLLPAKIANWERRAAERS